MVRARMRGGYDSGRGRAARAGGVELLEAGRSVLWTQALSLRQDTSEIRQRAPELAALLDSSRDILNEPAAARPIIHTVTQFGAAGPEARPPSRTTAEQRTLEQKRRAAHDWDTAVTSIRQLAGFETSCVPCHWPSSAWQPATVPWQSSISAVKAATRSSSLLRPPRRARCRLILPFW